LRNYDMSNAWFQESSDWKIWHDGACVSFVGSLISIRIFKQK